MRKPHSFSRPATLAWVVFAACACVDRSDVGAFGADAGAALPAAPRPASGDGADAGLEAPAPVTPSTSPLAAGGLSTCGLDANNGVFCWGDNQYGALGVGSFDPATSVLPVRVPELAKGVRSVVGGPYAHCAILADGTARCWGYSLFGDINGTIQSVQMPTPHDKTGLSNDVARITVGTLFVCALTTSGRGKCWGIGGAGQLGNGSTNDEFAARDVATTEPLVDIAASMGGFFACAVTRAGGVLCWGKNGSGQLGSSGTEDQPLPVAVKGLDAPSLGVACGREHACALLADGGVACWGSDARGQLGRGTFGKAAANPPARVGGVASATSLAVGGDHACAIAGGRVVCWGANRSGQIATGLPVLGPTEAAPTTKAPMAVTAGFEHTCVMSSQRAITCLGDGSRQQTGSKDFSL